MKYVMFIMSLIGLLSFPVISKAQYKYIITTVVGTGVAASDGDGGLAINAAINNPYSVALDGVNNLFVGDGGNVIRRIDAKTSKISTIAGTGVAGFSGDGGPAIDAKMTRPGIDLVDTRGNIYLSDDWRVRKIDDSHNINTIIGNGINGFSSDGGLADTTMISGAQIVMDDTGNIYLSDGSNCRIRRVDAATGIITTIAGTGSRIISGDGGPAISAGLVDPTGICLDKKNNLYIGSGADGKIRRINLKTGIISVYAGASVGYSGDGGPALSAGLYQPFSLLCDATGNLYIADIHDQVIRRVDAATGIINTIAGAKYGSTTGVGGFSGDGGDANNAKLRCPSGMAMDSSGSIYFADALNNRIRKLTIATGVNNVFLENILNIYPDPANDYIKLDIEHAQSAYIYNAMGMQISAVENINTTANSLDVSRLPSGVYIVAIIYKDGSKKTGRFVKQ